MSQVKIAQAVKCSRCAVQYALKRFRETRSHENKPRSGRARITTVLLSEEKGRAVSVYTVRRRLRKVGSKVCKARKKPWLSERNKKVSWRKSGVTYVRRRVGEAYNPDCVVPTVKHGGRSIMIWSCMAAGGVGEMLLCEGRMNSERYTEVFDAALALSITNLFGETNTENLKFQQDNATCHKSAHTMAWFAQNQVDLLDWPPQSPDLNLIEHIWSILKKNVRRHSLCNKKALLTALKREWEQISPSACLKLVESMPKRIAGVIKSEGGPTEYYLFD
nr:unnamed protein product [Callosobruchus chinensis]